MTLYPCCDWPDEDFITAYRAAVWPQQPQPKETDRETTTAA